MRRTISAIVIAAGLLGVGTAAQAAAIPASSPIGIAGESPAREVQLTRRERRMMRHHRMHRRMMHHRRMHHRMHRRMMRRM